MRKSLLVPFISFLVPISLAFGETPATPALHSPVTLAGTVTDPAGAAIAGAHVTIESDSGQKLAETVTDSTGNYRVTFESQGSRPVFEKTVAPGFRSSVLEGLLLGEGATRTEDVRLKLGGASETINVTSAAAVGNGQIATVSQLGILGTLDEFSTPFSVDSFTDTLVRDQQAQTVADVLLNEPGLQDANGRYSEDSYLQFRGFPLDTGASLINGLPFLVDYRSPSLENVGRIELFKGPSSLLNGSNEDSSVGGTINLVTKRAEERPSFTFDGGYSSDSDFEGHLDGGRRWIGDGIVGVRAQLGGRNGGTPIDNQSDHIANASIEADVRLNKFRASLDVSDQYRGLVAERGPLYIAPGIAVPKTPSLTSNVFDRSTSYTKHQYFVLGHAEYEPNTHVQIFGSYGHTQSPENYQGPYFPTITDAAGDVTVYDIPYHGEEHVNVSRVGAKATFATGRIEHQATITGDFTRQASGYFFEFLSPIQTNIYNPIPLSPLTSHTVPLKNIEDTGNTQNTSFAAADVMTAFNGKLVLIGGLRDQEIKVINLGSNARGSGNTNVFTPCTDPCVYDKSGVSPSGAGLFHVTSRLSLYANYIQDLEEGPTAPTGATNAGQIFPPSTSQQVEGGAKYAFAHAGATLALFRITEPNGVLNPTTNTFGLSGKQRNVGLEAEFFGNVSSSVRLVGGFTVINARQEDTGDAGTEGKRAQGVPSLQLTEGAEWNVPRSRGLFFTGRVTASSGQFADTAETQRIPAWGRLDLGGRYTLPIRHEPTLRVNFDNVTGNNYWESGLQGLSYGKPRSVRVSTGFRF